MLIGNFYIQPNSVWCNNAKVSLSADELAVFKKLAFHRGKPVTVAALMAYLYGDNESGIDSNIVKVRVCTLRRKLDKANDYINPIVTGPHGAGWYMCK